MAAEPTDTGAPAGAGWIRHEIRNPLNVVVGSLRLIEMAGVTPAQQKAIDQCRAAVDRITGLLDAMERASPSFAAAAGAELRALGGVSFLTKPFERSDLLRTVQVATGTHRNLRLLAADDVPEVGWLLESLLASTGATLEVVRDGGAAVTRAREQHFDLILLDLEMPVMDGAAAARAIRDDERRAGREAVPIVIASGHRLDGDAPVEARELDEDEVTPDPEVAPLVPEFLRNRRADVARLRDLIERRDWEGLRSSGHKMKGTGRGYGFPRITEIGLQIEQAGSSEDGAAAAAAVAALEQYLNRVKIRS